MNDYNRAVTLEDLIRKYNLDGMQKKVSKFQGELINTNGILEDFVETTTENLDLINNQLDGNVTSWFYNYVPTLLNIPASNWTTDELKDEHLEDLFYDANTGKVYKFVKDSDTYQWIEVTNVVGAQTFAVANASQDVLDGNRRTFFTTPTPPYDVGDLWADNTNHILYRCLTPKATGETFAVADWIDSLKYLSTDDGDKLVDSINSRKTTKTIGADKLFIEGDEIDLTSKTLSITSDNFSVDADGNMQCRDAKIRGYLDLYDQDEESTSEPVLSITGDTTTLIMSSYRRYMHSSDYSIWDWVDNSIAHTRYSHNYYKDVDISNNGLEIRDYVYDLKVTVNENGIDIIDEGLGITNGTFDHTGLFTAGTVTSTNGVCQGSLEELKKDFEEYNDSALDVVNNIDIYKYRYKTEDDTKKHIGFVIGNNYNYSQEVTNKDNDGVDLYSFVSVCCKAIQEQQKEIEELKEEISKLKEGRQ